MPTLAAAPTAAPVCTWAYHCPTCNHLLMFCTCVQPFTANADAPLLIELTPAAFAAVPGAVRDYDGPDFDDEPEPEDYITQYR